MRLAFILLVFMACAAWGETAEEMRSSCGKVVEASVTEGKVALPTDFESGRCWGAFASIQRAIAARSAGAHILRVCAPENSTRTQLIAIFIDFVKLNPKLMSEDFFITAVDSLRQAFPCPKKSP